MSKLSELKIDFRVTSLPGDEGKTSRMWADLPEESKIKLILSGRRALNDYVNSAKAEGKEPAEAFAMWMTRLDDGDWSDARGGGERLTPLAREIRAILFQVLSQFEKTAQAEKLSKDPEAAFRALAQRKAEKTGRDDLASMVDEISKVILAKAEANVAAREIDLG